MNDPIKQVGDGSVATPPRLPSGLTAGVWVGHHDATGVGDPGDASVPHPVARHSRRQKVVVGVTVVALLALGGAIGFTWLRHEPTFCSRIAALPSMTASLDQDGSPGRALISYADALDLAALGAPDLKTAKAAGVIADQQRALGTAVGGVASSEDVVEQVARLDSAASQQARDTLDDAIEEHCG
ncbi:hypothetical protein BH10ACT3_BH10ACT3_05060 [soil metagenome]